MHWLFRVHLKLLQLIINGYNKEKPKEYQIKKLRASVVSRTGAYIVNNVNTEQY